LLIWLPAIRCPAVFTVTIGLVAEASLYVYLTHFQVYPLFGAHTALGVVASIAVGVILTQLVTLLRRRIRDRRSLRSRLPFRDEPLLSQGGGHRTVNAAQAGGDHSPAAGSGGRPGLEEIPLVGTDRTVKPDR
jgi:hypothetical protein